MQINNNLTLIYLKVEQGSQQKVSALLDQDPQLINLENQKSGQTLLSVASRKNDYAMVQLLIEKGADVNITNKFGQTPLWIAAFYNFSQLSQLLLEMNCDYNIQDKKGWSPLMIAGKKGHNQIVQQLLEAGANYELCNKVKIFKVMNDQHKQGENVFDLSKDYETLQQMIQILGLQAVKVKYPIKFRHKRTQSSDLQFQQQRQKEDIVCIENNVQSSEVRQKQKQKQKSNEKYNYEHMIQKIFSLMEREVLEQLDNLKNYLICMSKNQKELNESLMEYSNLQQNTFQYSSENQMENLQNQFRLESCQLFIQTCENLIKVEEQVETVQRIPLKPVQNLSSITEEEFMRNDNFCNKSQYEDPRDSININLKLKELSKMLDSTIRQSNYQTT